LYQFLSPIVVEAQHGIDVAAAQGVGCAATCGSGDGEVGLDGEFV